MSESNPPRSARQDKVSSASAGSSRIPWRAAILPVGFLSLGLVLGVVTGLSTFDGISQALLTAVLSFVGGSVLTYAGFRRKRVAGDESEEIDSTAVGACLTALSVGMLLGLYGGIWARLDPPLPADLKAKLGGGATAAPSTAPTSGQETESEMAAGDLRDVFSLHGDTATICEAVRQQRIDGTYDSEPGLRLAKRHLDDLYERTCEAGGEGGL